MKTNQQVGVAIADDFSAVTFTVKGFEAKPIVLEMAKLSDAVRTRAACVGMAQVRIVDAAAIGAADKDGNIIPAEKRLEMKHTRMAELVAHYMTGTEEWSRVRASAGIAGGYLFEALCELYAASRTPEQIRAFLDGLSDKEQTALREDDTVSPIIAKIKKAKTEGQPKVDTAALLGNLTAATPEPTTEG